MNLYLRLAILLFRLIGLLGIILRRRWAPSPMPEELRIWSELGNVKKQIA